MVIVSDLFVWSLYLILGCAFTLFQGGRLHAVLQAHEILNPPLLAEKS